MREETGPEYGVPSRQLRQVISATALLLICFSVETTIAQDADDLQLFGSMQTVFFHQEARIEQYVPSLGQTYTGTETRNTFALQQMDLFFRKEIGEDFTAFVDLEFQLNYSSDKNWGSLSLQEAWMNYRYNDRFNIKTGLLFPAFNQLNEVKNRLALHPYLFRPMVYERLLANKFLAEDFIPEHAFVQVHGMFPVGIFFLDYAVYTGNAESSYITRSTPSGGIATDVNQNFEFLSGVDPTDIQFKLFGGRLGLRTRDEQMRCGVSMTHDYNNLRDSTRVPDHVLSTSARHLLGKDIPRIRLGGDISLNHGPFSLEAEIIKVLYDFDHPKNEALELEQHFIHTMIGYDVLEPLTVYASLQFGDYTFGLDADYLLYSVGTAFRVNHSISAKAQYIVYQESIDFTPIDFGSPIDQTVTIDFIFLGFSVLL